jgi:putative ABC transport system substrate-binding protein
MKRRDFIVGLASAAAWPIAGMAQTATLPTIGVLGAPAPEQIKDQIVAFQRGLKEGGYADGENVTVEYQWAEGRYDRLPAVAEDLMASRVAVILALAPPAAVAAKAATSTVPIVFVMGADPVALGLVASLNRPGGNVTGVNFLINALGEKRLQLIRELVPTAGTIGLLLNPGSPGNELDERDVLEVARTVGQNVRVFNVTSEREFENAFAALRRQGVSALIVSPDALFTSRRDQLVALAETQQIPVIYHLRQAAVAGGLMSYGTSITDAHRLAGVYIGRILKGEKAADLPVQQSIKFEFVINLKTAKALGLEVPSTLLAVADEVIE